MYIYCITNQVNNKKYVGSTNDPIRRKQEHFNSARWRSTASYYYPLQKAMRKYGIENFMFEVLEECSNDIAAQKEKEWIVKLNSLTNSGYGYNQTLETQCALQDINIIQQNIERTGTKCALVNEKNEIITVFRSYREAGKQILGVEESSPIRKVCNGECFSIKGFIFRRIKPDGTVEIPLNKTRKRRTAIIGTDITNKNDVVYYESVSEAARQENIDRSSLSKCISGSSRYSTVGGRIWRKVGDE